MNLKYKFVQTLSVVLAALLQLVPLMRTFLPTQALAPNAWGFILKIGMGATALMGFDAVSRASSISISPANATAGTPYSGTVSYSGGHSGSVSSMSYVSNSTSFCLGSSTYLGDGLSIVYNSKNTATVSGTPTVASNFTFSIKVYDASSCGSGHVDTHSTSLVIGASGGGVLAPVTPFASSPQNVCAQVGTDVQLSGGTSGNPLPQYQWWQGSTPISGATNSILTLTNVQLGNAGTYTLTASNSQTVGYTIGGTGNGPLPQAGAVLAVCVTGGTNFTTFNYTNYAPAGVTNVFHSYITNNYSTLTNYYSWAYNNGTAKTNTGDYPKLVTPVDGGNYTVTFNVTNKVSSLAILTNQQYDSYWVFGYLPNFTNQLPATTNVTPGGNVTFNVGIQGDLNVITSGGLTSFGTNNFPCVFWYKDGNLISSQVYTNGPYTATLYTNSVVNASLTLNNVASSTNGNYTVVVTNYWGSITSTPVALTVGSVGSAPGISQQPLANISLLVGQSTNISVTATGTPSLFYQWRTNGVNLANGGVYSGVNTNILLLTAVTTNNSRIYSVVITNASGSVTSTVANVLVYSLPSMIVSNSGSSTVGFNGVTATGITYVVMMATNLAPPNWVDIVTNNTGVSGNINFQTNTTSGPNQYYKLRFP